jgi:hypothetical protein
MSKKKTNVGNVIMWGGTDYHYVKNNDGKDVLDSLTITTQGYGKYKGYKGETNLKTRAIFIGNAKKALNSWSKKDEAKAKAEIKRFYKILTGGGEKGFGCPISDMGYMLVNWFYRGYEKEVALIISVIDPENKHFTIPENEPASEEVAPVAVAESKAENAEPVAVAENATEKKDDNLSWINNIPMPSKEEVAAEIERAIMEGAEKERERLRSEMTEEEKRNEIIYNILAHKYEFVKDENGKEHGVLKAESNDESNEPVADNQAESVEPVATYSEKDITVFDCGGEFELKTAARRAIKQMLATGTASLKTGGVKYEIRYLHPSWRDYGRHYQLKAGGELESGFMLVNFDAVFPAAAFDNMGKLTGPASEIVNDDFILQPLKPLYKPFFEPMEGAEIVEVENFEPIETIADEHQAEPVADNQAESVESAPVAVAESKAESVESVEPIAETAPENVEPVADIVSYGTPARIIGGELTTAEKRAVARIMTEKTCTVEDAENSYHLGYNNTLEITNKASGETTVKNFTIKIETADPVADNQAESVEPVATVDESKPENSEPVAAAESVEPIAETAPEPVAESKAESVEPVAESKAEVDRVIKKILTGVPTLRMKIIEDGCCLSTAEGNLKEVMIYPKTGRRIELYGEKLREKLKEVEGYIGYKFTTDLIAGRRVYIEQARNTGTENTVKIWVLTRSRDMKPEALTCITKSRPWTITTSDWVTVNKQVYNLLMEDAA